MGYAGPTEKGLVGELLRGPKPSKRVLPYESKFDGRDTEDLVAKFMAERGGEVTKCPTQSMATGQIRFNFAESRRRKIEEEGMSVDELPDYLLTYAEKKERKERQRAKQRGR